MHSKPRAPGSFPRAIMEAIESVGVQSLADVCEVSTSLVSQWSQDDNPRLPNVRQALDLDAFMKAHCGTSPIHSVYDRRLDQISAPTISMTLNDAVLEATTGLGHLAAAIRAAKAPTGPGGRRMTPCERSNVADKVSMLERKIDQIKASLECEGGEVVPFTEAAE